MKNMNRKFLTAGLLAAALTFVGCKSDKSAERTDDTPQTTPSGTTDQDTTPPPTEGTTDTPAPGTGGAGPDGTSETQRPDDTSRLPEDPREREDERGVHDNDPDTGGSGFGSEATDDTPNQGGNMDDTTRVPDMPSDTPPDGNTSSDSQIPEGIR